jgi:CRISPR-associated protein Cmr5
MIVMSQENTIIQINQRRASHALNRVNAVKADKEEYKQYTKKLPMMIKTSGLAYVLAFCKAKSGPYDQIRKDIDDWVKHKDCPFQQVNGLEEKALLSLPQDQYMALTMEIISYLSWLRRYAEAEIKSN